MSRLTDLLKHARKLDPQLGADPEAEFRLVKEAVRYAHDRLHKGARRSQLLTFSRA